VSVKSKSFSCFGVKYRTRQFNAVLGLEIMGAARELHPTDLLSTTDVEISRGEWAGLADGNNINEYVRDAIGFLPSVLALRGLVEVVRDYNFAFVSNWKGVKIPRRLVDGAPSVKSEHVSPMVAQIVQDGAATLRELEEYYSLHDAFKMFDIIVVKGLNNALSNESANAKMKRR
jgi:hypothetical protein